MKTKLFSAIALSVASVVLSVHAKDGFVAHEWGTFTSVQGADGIQLQWNPLIHTDLPEFVYRRDRQNGGFPASYLLSNPFGKDSSMPSFVRMETPVIYFYSDEPLTANVLVNFNGGRITEWYPQATRVGPYITTNKAEAPQAGRSFIEWTGVKILPRNTKEISADTLIREKDDNHYYSARETGANFLRTQSPSARSGAEYERDLFYRGVGAFQAPLTLKLDGRENDLELSTTDTRPLTDLFVLTVRNGLARYQYVDRVGRTGQRHVKLDRKPFVPLSDVREQIMREMALALARQGLYDKEARAMVNTWKDQWFAEEGVRVLYILPRAWTDNTLPLAINPQPTDVVRVMVGRAELITRTMERELSKQVTIYSKGDDHVKLQAVNEVRQLGFGRFLEPATRKMLGTNPDKAFAQAAWNLAQEASKPVDGKSPTVVEKQLQPVPPKTAAVHDARTEFGYTTFQAR